MTAPDATTVRDAGGSVYPRVNSLNAVRLTLAAAVVVDHALPVGGFGGDPMVGRISLGALAVFSFFGLSGFLITGSARRSGPRDFVVNRVLRIAPGLWVCLLVTAFVLSPLARAFNVASTRPFEFVDSAGYVVKNLLLVVVQPAVGDTLAGAPHPDVWNASLWTLPFEFACYLAVLLLAVLGVLRRPRVLYALTALLAVVAVPALVSSDVANRVGVTGMHVSELFLMFGFGACLRVQRRVRLDDLRWGFAALVTSVAALTLFEHPTPLLGLPLCYALLCFGARVRCPAVLRRNDVSYGVYIYGMPVEQLLAQTRLGQHGLLLYTVSAFVVTLPLAVLSWTLVERRALAMKQHRASAAVATSAAGTVTALANATTPVSSPALGFTQT